MIEDEINAMLERGGAGPGNIVWMERGYHEDPDNLRRVLQEEIDKAAGRGFTEILLAYGLCGNGTAGLVSDKAEIVIPRYDDCVNMMLCAGRENQGRRF